MNGSKVVLIAYKFPPFNGVGANRWAHLSVRLKKLGYDMTVLTVDRGEVPIEFSTLDVRKISKFGLYNLISLSFRNRLFNAIYGKIIHYIKILFWFDDEAQYWGGVLLTEIENIIEKHGKIIIIATGHPFQANRLAAEAKKKFSDKIFLIQDFRDPWFDNPFKKYLFSFQERRVKNWQEEALSISDKNVFVTEGLKKLMEINFSKAIVIENGHSFATNSAFSRKIDGFIIHAGTLANGRDKAAEPFFKLCQSKPEVLGGKNVVFYGRISIWLIKKYSSLFKSGVFLLNDSIAQEKLDLEYSKASYALQFNAKEYPFLVSTKIYEHASKGLPTLSINYGGEIKELISKNNIGESAFPDEKKIETAMFDIERKCYRDSLLNFSILSSYDIRAKDYAKLIEQAFREISLYD